MSDNVFQRASATVGKAVRRGVLLGVIAGATVTAAAIIAPVEAGTIRQRVAPFKPQNFLSAARLLQP